MAAVAAPAAAARTAFAHLAAAAAGSATTTTAAAAAPAAAARTASAPAAIAATAAAPVARVASEVAARLAARITAEVPARLSAIGARFTALGIGGLGRAIHRLTIHDARPFFVPLAKGCETGDTGSGSSWRRALDSPETRSRPAVRMVSGGSDHGEETSRSASAPREAAHSELGRFLYQWDASPVRREGACL